MTARTAARTARTAARTPARTVARSSRLRALALVTFAIVTPACGSCVGGSSSTGSPDPTTSAPPPPVARGTNGEDLGSTMAQEYPVVPGASASAPPARK